MGNKTSNVVNPVDVKIEPSPTTPPPIITPNLKDTTFRSVIFGKREIELAKNSVGQMVVKEQVDKSTFDSYVHFLKIMAQLSRIVYCDTGIIHLVGYSPVFGTPDNVGVNSKITMDEKEFLPLRRKNSSEPNSKNGRPMLSYVTPKSSSTAPFGMITYLSSPSDLTCMFIQGSHLAKKHSAIKDTDLIIAFKGSSTFKNFKHDLYSQFSAVEFSKLIPSGFTPTSNDIGNVPASFVKPVIKSWHLLDEIIKERAPTRLIVCGHSLGGAYATMFAFIICQLQTYYPSIKSAHLCTFGAPTLLSDKARGSFNQFLDSGFLTFDRVISVGNTSKIMDIIPGIPVGFSHPGYQPLRTELYPEKKTGRAYNINNLRLVYQRGGVFGIGQNKKMYEVETKRQMPNKVVIPAISAIGNSFAHAEYFDLTWLNAFRLVGMKNPGFFGNTFIAQIHEDGIAFKYVPADPSDTPVADPTTNESMGSITSVDLQQITTIEPSAETSTTAVSPSQGGGKKTRRHIKQRKNRNRNTIKHTPTPTHPE
jgi:hypothetical protein